MGSIFGSWRTTLTGLAVGLGIAAQKGFSREGILLGLAFILQGAVAGDSKPKQ